MGCSKWALGVVMLGLIIMSPVYGITCGDAVSAMIPCESFLLGDGGPSPSLQCCSSVKSLNNMAKDLAARKALCECFKQNGPSFGVKPEKAKALPFLCKLKININISPNVNCNTIK